MTAIAELFLSTENAYPHAERAFRNITGIEKQWGPLPLRGDRAGLQAVAAPCCMRTVTEGLPPGSCICRTPAVRS